ncbi:hypothetical protein ACHAXR_000026 [Thalassiosira sp. AJA248-18]
MSMKPAAMLAFMASGRAAASASLMSASLTLTLMPAAIGISYLPRCLPIKRRRKNANIWMFALSCGRTSPP